jgi:5-methylthioribose kinase
MVLDTPEGYARLDVGSLGEYIAGLPALRSRLGGAPPEWRVREVGDGNLNLVFVVDGPDGALCVKQSLPHIRAIESWRLTVERTSFENAYFAAVRPHVGALIPTIYHYEPRLYCLVMEKLEPHIILRRGLVAGNRYPRVARDTAEYVARATFFTSDLGQPLEAKMDGIALFARNHALVRITSDLVFTDPYRINERNRWTSPQLDAIAAEFRADAPLKIAAARRGQQFLSQAQALIHGDLHTGSLMVTPGDTRIIDPEFGFYGPIGMDLGAFSGNLLMSYLSQPGHATPESPRDDFAEWILAQIPIFWNHFADRFLELWETQPGGDAYASSMFADEPSRAALRAERQAFIATLFDDMLGFAAVKMIRRILGFAHNIDFDSIADPDRRAACETATLRLARSLLIHPDRVRTIDDLLDAARRTAPRVQRAPAAKDLTA